MASIEVSGRAMMNAPSNVERLAISSAASNTPTLKRILTMNRVTSQTGKFSLAYYLKRHFTTLPPPISPNMRI